MIASPVGRLVLDDARQLHQTRVSAAVAVLRLLHHLNPEEAISFLRHAWSLTRGWLIVADLVRCCFAYFGFTLFAKLARFHPVSLHDGQVSVRRAYTPPELAELASAAGLRGFRIHRHAFCRMALVCGRAACV